MSTSGKRPGLSHPAVIGVVVVLMAAVVVLNVRTFGSRSARNQRSVTAEVSAEGVPGDLDRLLERSAAAGLATSEAGWGKAPDVRRDPFSDEILTEKPAPRVPRTAGPSRSRSRSDSQLVCSAVMLGGKRPLAWINGRKVGVGEVVSGWRVTAIDPDGPHLQAGRDKQLFLPVGGGDKGNQKYRVVTGEGNT